MAMAATVAPEAGGGALAPAAQRHRPHVMDRPHWHRHVEAFLLLSGRIWTEMRGREVEIEAGRLGLFWSSFPHRVTRVEGNGDICLLNVPVSRFRRWPVSVAQRLAVTAGQIVLADRPIGHQARLFETWIADRDGGDGARRDLAFEEAAGLFRRLDVEGWSAGGLPWRRPLADRAASDPVDRMIRLVDAEYRRPDLRVDDVAAAARLHPNYAMAVFREAMGMTIGAYLTHTRLVEAQDLLLTSGHKIMTVAAEAGFASPSRFHSVFRAHLGTTPARYRALGGSPEEPGEPDEIGPP